MAPLLSKKVDDLNRLHLSTMARFLQYLKKPKLTLLLTVNAWSLWLVSFGKPMMVFMGAAKNLL